MVRTGLWAKGMAHWMRDRIPVDYPRGCEQIARRFALIPWPGGAGRPRSSRSRKPPSGLTMLRSSKADRASAWWFQVSPGARQCGKGFHQKAAPRSRERTLRCHARLAQGVKLLDSPVEAVRQRPTGLRDFIGQYMFNMDRHYEYLDSRLGRS